MTVFFWLWITILAGLVIAFIVVTILMFAPDGALRRPKAAGRPIDDRSSAA